MEERRKEPRQRVLKVGKVVFGAQDCLYDCRIRDMTARGARLRIEHAWQVPETFTFVNTSAASAKCVARVVWRGQSEVGIAFKDAA